MSTTPHALEVHIHLVDGRVIQFVQDQVVAAQKVLDHIQPKRLFTAQNLMVGGGHALTAIPSSAIVRLDLIGDRLPDWSFQFEAEDIQEITEEDYIARYRPDALEMALPGERITVYAEMEMANGQRLFTEVHTRLELRLPLEQNVFIQQIFSAGGLHFRRRTGGISILNPANITRLTFYPGPTLLPAGAWELTHLSG